MRGILLTLCDDAAALLQDIREQAAKDRPGIQAEAVATLREAKDALERSLSALRRVSSIGSRK